MQSSVNSILDIVRTCVRALRDYLGMTRRVQLIVLRMAMALNV